MAKQVKNSRIVAAGTGAKPISTGTVTLSDVAKHAGVGKSTASAVLTGASSKFRISALTQERVHRSASELRYRPNAIARGLARGRMNTLGIVIAAQDASFLGQAYNGTLVQGIVDMALRRRQFITLLVGDIWLDARHNLSIYCDGRTDGLLLLPQRDTNEIAAALLGTGVPFVHIGDQSPVPEITSVDVDNVEGAKIMTTYLLEQGHRRIAFMYRSAPNNFLGLRQQGYREALERWGISYDESLIAVVDYSDETERAAVDAMMGMPAGLRPTAVFAYNDDLAISVMKILQEKGLRVPEDISVAGFDDFPSAAPRSLTTIRQNPHLIGGRAVELLLAQIQDNVPSGQKEVTPAELVIRHTVAPPRQEPIQ